MTFQHYNAPVLDSAVVQEQLRQYEHNVFRFPCRQQGNVIMPDSAGFFFELNQLGAQGLEQLMTSAHYASPRHELPEGIHTWLTFRTHAQTDTNAAHLRTGVQGSMLDETGKRLVELQAAGIGHYGAPERAPDAVKPYLARAPDVVVVADALRTMDDALCMYFPDDHDLQERLDAMALKVQRDIAVHHTVDHSYYIALIGLCVERGIIPTPLLRTMYQRDAELWPERHPSWFPEGVERDALQAQWDAFKPEYIRRVVQKGKSEQDAIHDFERTEARLAGMKDPAYAAHEQGLPISENRIMMAMRTYEFMDLLAGPLHDVIQGRVVDIVLPSGTLDAALSWLYHQEDQHTINIMRRPKPKVRGEIIHVAADEDMRYTNDPRQLGEYTERTVSARARLLNLSYDQLVRNANGKRPEGHIMEQVLVPSGARTYDVRPVSVEDILDQNVPTIIQAEMGSGKSILMTELVRDVNARPGYVANLVIARDLSADLESHGQGISTAALVAHLSGKWDALPATLRDDYQLVTMIDGLDESPEFQALLLDAMQRMPGKVIVTTRPLGLDSASGRYQVLDIDTEHIMRNLDTYIAARWQDAGKRRWFRHVLDNQDPVFRQNYLRLYSLVKVAQEDPDFLDDHPNPTSIYLRGLGFSLLEHDMLKNPINRDYQRLRRLQHAPDGEPEALRAQRRRAYETAREPHVQKMLHRQGTLALLQALEFPQGVPEAVLEARLAEGWGIPQIIAARKAAGGT